MSTFLQGFGRRRIGVALLLGLVVAGTALLVQAQVEGTEDKPASDVHAGGEDGLSHHGTFVASVRPFASRHEEHIPGSELPVDSGDENASTAVGVPAREIGFAGCEEPALAMDQMFAGDDEESRGE